MVLIINRFISLFTSVLLAATSFAFGDFTAPYAPEDADSCLLNFAAISDVHMTDEGSRALMLELGLDDMQNAAVKPDALVLVGDNTDHGNSDQYANLVSCFSKYNPADEIYLTVGNHDTWNNETEGDNRFVKSKELFLENYKTICGRQLDNVYYSAEVNGYSFIFLSSEGDSTCAYISDTQLKWFDAEMAKAAKKGLPIFVFCHQPLNGTHGLPKTWLVSPVLSDDSELEPNDGGLGDESDAVKAILKKYENVFYITGHLHSGVSTSATVINPYSSVETDGTLHLVNLPSYMYMTLKGRMCNGMGYALEVYDSEVLIRARCFSSGVWYTADTFTIPIS